MTKTNLKLILRNYYWSGETQEYISQYLNAEGIEDPVTKKTGKWTAQRVGKYGREFGLKKRKIKKVGYTKEQPQKLTPDPLEPVPMGPGRIEIIGYGKKHQEPKSVFDNVAVFIMLWIILAMNLFVALTIGMSDHL